MTDEDQWRQRVRASFSQQGPLTWLGAAITSVERGAVDIELRFRPEAAQHLGTFHGGIIATLLDTACGMAALSCMDGDSEVLTAEFKTNFLRPAPAPLLTARGRVVKSGRTLTVCTGSAYAQGADGAGIQVALMQATMMAVRRR